MHIPKCQGVFIHLLMHLPKCQGVFIHLLMHIPKCQGVFILLLICIFQNAKVFLYQNVKVFLSTSWCVFQNVRCFYPPLDAYSKMSRCFYSPLDAYSKMPKCFNRSAFNLWFDLIYFLFNKVFQTWKKCETPCNLKSLPIAKRSMYQKLFLERCTILPMPQNAEVTPVECSTSTTDVIPDTICLYTCYEEFRISADSTRGTNLVQSAIRTCFRNGTWSGNPLTCNRVCPPQNNPENGQVFCR